MRLYHLNHAPIDFVFIQTPDNFVVNEIPLYPFSGSGEHLVLTVRKKGLTTHELLNILSSNLGVKSLDIGYAGLKDKNAMTIQHISIPKKCEERLATFSHPQIKILETTAHNNKIRLGHLKGNRFFIRLKKVSKLNATKLEHTLKNIAENGMPNYFGYQRFGKEGNNFQIGESLKELKKPKKMDKFFINAYQSALFNEWLNKRIIFSKEAEIKGEIKEQPQFFKLLKGDILNHYPHGKLFYADDANSEALRFKSKEVAPTGLLCGSKVKIAQDDAYEIEKDFIDGDIKISGDRRYAWIFPENIESEYKESDGWMELHFELPKGSYATVLLEALANRELEIS